MSEENSPHFSYGHSDGWDDGYAVAKKREATGPQPPNSSWRVMYDRGYARGYGEGYAAGKSEEDAKKSDRAA